MNDNKTKILRHTTVNMVKICPVQQLCICYRFNSLRY